MRLLAYLYLLCQSGALFTIPPAEQIYDVIITPFTPATETVLPVTTFTTLRHSDLTHNLEKSIPQLFPTTLITMAPLSRSALEMRQKYINDQGLGMDCGAWTGSHCTKVLPAKDLSQARLEISRISKSTHENDGSNSIMPLAISYIILMNLMTLWAAMSLA